VSSTFVKFDVAAALARIRAEAAAAPPESTKPPADEAAETDRIAQQDRARNERDQEAKRGYDHEDKANVDAPPVNRTAADERREFIPDPIRQKIEAIEAEAHAAGWTAEQLWSRPFWNIPRGLAAVMQDDDEIVAVTPDSIEILRYRRDVLRFRRHNA